MKLLELSPQPAGEEGLTNRIDNEAEIGLFDPIYRQRIVNAAGARSTSRSTTSSPT